MQPQLVIVTGDAAHGKTRLIEEFSKQAVAERAAVSITVHCSPVEATRIAYAPIASLLRALIGELPDLLATVDEPVRRVVSSLVTGAAPTSAYAGEVSHAQLFAGVVDVLSRCGTPRHADVSSAVEAVRDLVLSDLEVCDPRP